MVVHRGRKHQTGAGKERDYNAIFAPYGDYGNYKSFGSNQARLLVSGALNSAMSAKLVTGDDLCTKSPPLRRLLRSRKSTHGLLERARASKPRRCRKFSSPSVATRIYPQQYATGSKRVNAFFILDED